MSRPMAEESLLKVEEGKAVNGDGLTLAPPSRTQKTAESADGEYLSLRTKILYTFPAISNATMGMLLIGFLPIFYSDTLGVALQLISVTQYIGGVVATFSVIYVGYISDKLNWNFGRRRPILFIGTPFAALSFFFLFFPIPSVRYGPLAGLSIWFGVFYVIFEVSRNIADLAAGSLRIELTQDGQQRTSVFVLFGAFVVSGVIVGSILIVIAEPVTGSEENGFRLIASVVAASFLVLHLALAIFAKENRAFWRKAVPTVPAARLCVRNDPWVKYLVSHIAVTSMNAVTGVYVFMMEYVFGVDAAVWYAVFGAVYSILSVAFVPMWHIALKKHHVDKVTAFKVAQVLLIIHGSLAFLSTYLNIYVFIASLPFFAMWSSGHNIIDPILLADCVDYDELSSGKRREGTYFAISKLPGIFFDVAVRALPLILMDTYGYDGDQDTQPVAVQNVLRSFVGFAPILLGVAGLIIIAWYPITGDKHSKIMDAIKKLNEGEDANDPITGRTCVRPRSYDTSPDVENELTQHDKEWLPYYFSTREVHLLSTFGMAGMTQIRSEIYFSLFCWLSSTGLLIWQALSLLSDVESGGEFGFMAIAIASFIVFIFAYDAARLPSILRVMNMDTSLKAQAVRLILEINAPEEMQKKSLLNGVVAGGLVAEEEMETEGESSDENRTGCGNFLVFVAWRLVAFLPTLVVYILGVYI